MAARGLAIRADVATATELRRLAKKEPRRRTAQRMLAIANALDGTLPDLCRFVEARFDKRMCPQSMSRVVRRLGLSKQKARPVHPKRDAKAAEAFAKRGPSMP